MTKNDVLKLFCENCGTYAIEGVCPKELLGKSAKCSTKEKFEAMLDQYRQSIVEEVVGSVPCETREPADEASIDMAMGYNKHCEEVSEAIKKIKEG